jgi:hypothetical protein
MQSQTIPGDTPQTKPEGGFVEVSTFIIGLLWWAYSKGLISLRAVRVGLALFELRIRRAAYVWTERKQNDRTPDFIPRYTVHEIADFVGLPPKKARAALAELLRLGIVAEFDETLILFPRSLDSVHLSVEQKAEFEEWAATTFKKRKRIPIPRRALALAVESSFPAQIATILAVCLRCCFYFPKEKRYKGSGRISCAWIAATFGVCLRAVKRARTALVALGWIEPTGKINRRGEVVAINLAWERLTGLAEATENPEARAGGELPPEVEPAGQDEPQATSTHPSSGPQNAPLPPPTGPRNAPPLLGSESPLGERNTRRESPEEPPVPPCVHPTVEPSPAAGPGISFSPSGGEEKYQDTSRNVPSAPPAEFGPGVFSSRVEEQENPPQQPSLPARPEISPHQGREKSQDRSEVLPPPRLSDIRPEDFKDVGRALELFRQAVKCGLMPNDSEHSRLLWMAAIERARTVPAKNPAGLFLFLVKNKKWTFLSEAHFDAANRRLKAYLFGDRPKTSPLAGGLFTGKSVQESATPRLSRDALTIQAVRSALAQKGLRVADLLPHLRKVDPTWTRDRLNAAEAELAGPRLRPCQPVGEALPALMGQ